MRSEAPGRAERVEELGVVAAGRVVRALEAEVGRQALELLARARRG